jgi:hypothetical protein
MSRPRLADTVAVLEARVRALEQKALAEERKALEDRALNAYSMGIGVRELLYQIGCWDKGRKLPRELRQVLDHALEASR